MPEGPDDRRPALRIALDVMLMLVSQPAPQSGVRRALQALSGAPLYHLATRTREESLARAFGMDVFPNADDYKEQE